MVKADKADKADKANNKAAVKAIKASLKSIKTKLKTEARTPTPTPTESKSVSIDDIEKLHPDIKMLKYMFCISLLICLAINSYLVNYIFKLETTGCECAKDWRRDYIQYYFILLIVFIVIQFGVLFMGGLSALIGINMAFGGIMFILGIMFIVFTLQYVHKLKRIKCQCSEATARTVLEIVAYINLFMYSLIAIKFVVLLIMLLIVGSRR